MPSLSPLFSDSLCDSICDLPLYLFGGVPGWDWWRDTRSSFIIIGVFIIIPLFIKVLRDMGGEREAVKPEECREGEREALWVTERQWSKWQEGKKKTLGRENEWENNRKRGEKSEGWGKWDVGTRNEGKMKAWGFYHLFIRLVALSNTQMLLRHCKTHWELQWTRKHMHSSEKLTQGYILSSKLNKAIICSFSI